MSFPNLTASTLPKNILSLSKVETRDHSNDCISFWQYADALFKLQNTKVFNYRTKRALKELYFTNTLLTADDLKNLLQEKDKVVAQGRWGLGGFGVALYTTITQTWPSIPFPLPAATINGKRNRNVYLQIFIDIIVYPKTNYLIYFCLKSRFRAALTHCMGESMIQSW